MTYYIYNMSLINICINIYIFIYKMSLGNDILGESTHARKCVYFLIFEHNFSLVIKKDLLT